MSHKGSKNVSNPFPTRRPWMTRYGAAAAAKDQKGLRAVVAGGTTGAVEVLLTYPTEFVKTQLQLDGKGESKQYDGIIDVIKKTFKNKGFFGFYRGMSILLLGSVPKVAVRFGSFETIKQMIVNDMGLLTAERKLFAGLCAGVTEAIFVVTPMETIKVAFINDQRLPNPKYKGLFHGVREIVKDQGYRGIYKGVTATILKQGSNQAIRFFIMETCKDWYRKGDISKPVPTPLVGAFGFFAGSMSTLANNPVDMVKTRMQGLESSKYKNTIDCFVKVWKKEGILAFYKGVIPRLARTCINVAFTFMLYDSIMDLFRIIWPS